MADDLDRSFYVYLHIDKAAGVPFYVGKGRGSRASSTEGRNAEWQAKVESLPQGYDVQIAKSNLTEVEAWDLEVELIRKHGKIADGTGSLVNILDGGEPGLAAVVELSGLGDYFAEVAQRDYDSRTYREPDAEEEAEFLDDVENLLGWLVSKADVFSEDTDLEITFGMATDMVREVIRDRRKRRIPWKDVAYSLEDAVDTLDLDGLILEDESPDLVAAAEELQEMLLTEVAWFKEPFRGKRPARPGPRLPPPKPKWLQRQEAIYSGDPDAVREALELLRTDPVERNFRLSDLVEQTYRRCKDSPALRAICEQVAWQHVDEFPSLEEAVRIDHRRRYGHLPKERPLGVSAFAVLTTLLTEKGDYDRAIAVCKRAMHFGLDDGTKTGYAGRIERIRRKQRKARNDGH